MKAIIFFACVLLALNNYVQAGYYSTCEIEGWQDDNWGTFIFKMPINDTYRGLIATFKTRNILRMKIKELKYLNATFENQTLTFFTSATFENYEKESEYTSSPSISVEINALCTEDSDERWIFRQPILDTNNHAPIIHNKRYDYSLGMTIPKGLKLTDILSIRATEYDITNSGVYFTMEENEYFTLERSGKATSYKSKEFYTTLVAQKNITAPFSKSFTLVVSDNGHPVRTSSVPLTITVSTPQELEANQLENSDPVEVIEEGKMVHPPVFEKHVYFADYSSQHELKIEEPIIIKYGAESNTQLKQKGYEKYIKVRFADSNHEKIVIDKLISLPNEIIESTDLITIEIEAVNLGLDMPGRTALLIRLPNLGGNSNVNSDGNTNGNSKECYSTINYGYSFSGSAVPLVLFLITVFCIIFINIYIAVMFVHRNKMGFPTA